MTYSVADPGGGGPAPPTPVKTGQKSFASHRPSIGQIFGSTAAHCTTHICTWIHVSVKYFCVVHKFESHTCAIYLWQIAYKFNMQKLDYQFVIKQIKLCIVIEIAKLEIF